MLDDPLGMIFFILFGFGIIAYFMNLSSRIDYIIRLLEKDQDLEETQA